MTAVALASGRNVFRSEIARARALGFRLLLALDEGAAYAKLVPETDRARACARAHDGDAIEAAQAFTPDPNPRENAALALDAQRMAIEAALVHARDSYV